MKYLKLGREQELEADRFTGFIMYKYGADLADIMNMYHKISNNYDDSESTHPNLNKRLDAVKAGYDLATMKSKSDTQKIDLQEIKGNKIDFEVKDLSRIERNRLIIKVKKASTWEAMRYVDDHSKYDFGHGSGDFPAEYVEKIIRYHGQKEKYWLIDNDIEYLEVLNQMLVLADDNRIKFWPVTAIHIKGGILKLLIFTTADDSKVVYSAPFTEEQISLEEIRTIFIEIFKNGIQKEIDKYD